MKSRCLPKSAVVGWGWGNAIYKAISASRESPITQNYFLKFGLCSSLRRKGNPARSACNQADGEDWGESHNGRGAPALFCTAGAQENHFQGPSRPLGWSPRRLHQRPHSSHSVLLNFKAHIYVPQVAREPPRVKQFGADGRGARSRPGTFRNTISLRAPLPSRFFRVPPGDGYPTDALDTFRMEHFPG